MEVVNIKVTELRKKGIQNFQEWAANPNNVYIGRNMSLYVSGANASKWQNPYCAKKYGLDECLKLYEKHIRESPELLAALPELKGKTLGCWCKPNKCHGDILIALLKERSPFQTHHKKVSL